MNRKFEDSIIPLQGKSKRKHLTFGNPFNVDDCEQVQLCKICTNLSCVRFMMSLNCLSTAKKALLSLGSCRWMSGALNILSKYIHCFWHSHHSSNTFPKCLSWFSIFSTSFLIPATNLRRIFIRVRPFEWNRQDSNNLFILQGFHSLIDQLKGCLCTQHNFVWMHLHS